jgi:hypothetical protein
MSLDLNGRTVDQIVGEATGQVGAALGGFLSSQYGRFTVRTLSAGFCGCIAAFCDAGDFTTGCDGAMPTDGSGFLTQIDQDLATNSCEACGCSTGLVTSFSAGAICLNL